MLQYAVFTVRDSRMDLRLGWPDMAVWLVVVGSDTTDPAAVATGTTLISS